MAPQDCYTEIHGQILSGHRVSSYPKIRRLTRVEQPALFGLRVKAVKVAPVVVCAYLLADFYGLGDLGVENDTLAQTCSTAEFLARNLA